MFKLFAIKTRTPIKFLNNMTVIFKFCYYTCGEFSWLLANLIKRRT